MAVPTGFSYCQASGAVELIAALSMAPSINYDGTIKMDTVYKFCWFECNGDSVPLDNTLSKCECSGDTCHDQGTYVSVRPNAKSNMSFSSSSGSGNFSYIC
eukprot:1190852-Prorocentrum_minimum.AAC.1